MCLQCLTLDPQIQDYDTHGIQSAGSVDGSYSGGLSAGLPVYSVDQIADYLTTGFWQDKGAAGQRSFDVQTGGTITVNINGLDATGRATALEALEAWTAVTGITFQQSSGAMITFDDTQAGAYATSSVGGTTIYSSHVNVHASWQGYGDYYLQTFIHEIGHALGLGHGGNYNGSANFGSDAHYANDSWQMTVMSYFSQTQNPYVSADYTFLGSAMMADIVAIQNLYGQPANVQTGNSVYGDGNNTGWSMMALPTNRAVTIYDSAGTDTIDLGSRSHNQRLDLRAETFSDINGRTGNLGIARGTEIENAVTGGGQDHVTGNDAVNAISTGAGNDTLIGHGGSDYLTGGLGADTMTGGSGGDRYIYASTSEGGDTITDFSLADGDRVDIGALLTAAGYSGSDAGADGYVSLVATLGGSRLMFDADGMGAGGAVELAFLQGVDASTSVSEIIDATGTPPTDPDPGGSTDTIYTFTDAYPVTWSLAQSYISDFDGGTDTLDLSAVTLMTRIYLEEGVRGRVGKKALTISEGTVIENVLLGSANDTSKGNAADNLMDGGAGNDRLYGYTGSDTMSGGAGSDTLYGGGHSDTLDGGDGADRLYAGAGHDTVVGGAEGDKLFGQAGDDSLDGGEGDDRIYGGDGSDTLSGGTGADRLYGDAGDDVMTGGDGKDYLYGGDGADSIDAGAGDDRITAGAGDDILTAGDGNDFLKSEDGHDLMDGGSGNDKLYGGDGDDIGYGGDGNDYLRGDDGTDLLDGGGGDDRLFGGDGDDAMTGGDGDDYLRGDDGDDVLDAGDGANKLYGNRGDDTLSSGSGDDYLKGDLGNDTISAGAGNDRIYGDLGNDTISAGDGEDFIKAGTGDDIVFGGAGADRVYGERGADQIDGGAGDDYIDASSDDDVIAGGEGADYIKGGSGSDIFVFRTVAEAGDTIADFSLRYGDMLDVSGLLDGTGHTVASAISSGVFALTEAGRRDSWFEFDADGEGGADAVQVAYLRIFAADTELSESWIL